MLPADFISGSRDVTQHLTSGELILIHSADTCILVQIAHAYSEKPFRASLTTRPLPTVTAAPSETGFNNLVPRVSLLLAWEKDKPWERDCGFNSLPILTKVPNNKQIYPLVNLDLMSWTAMSFAAVKGHAHVCQVYNNLSLALGYVAKKTILIVLIIRTARFPDLCTLKATCQVSGIL